MADIPLIKFCTSNSVNMTVMMYSQTITSDRVDKRTIVWRVFRNDA
jgi:hypothetical protein